MPELPFVELGAGVLVGTALVDMPDWAPPAVGGTVGVALPVSLTAALELFVSAGHPTAAETFALTGCKTAHSTDGWDRLVCAPDGVDLSVAPPGLPTAGAVDPPVAGEPVEPVWLLDPLGEPVAKLVPEGPVPVI